MRKAVIATDIQNGTQNGIQQRAQNSETLPILYQDESIVVVHKPSGIHVHPPELDAYRVRREFIAMYILKKQLGQKIFPVHRLDAGTSGVLVFALSSEAARDLQICFQSGQMTKTYHAVARGWLPAEGQIDIPLESDSSDQLVQACTRFKTITQIELDAAVGKRFSKARYSLVEVIPVTGRFHQIRRHLNRISHPIIGDAHHGDSHHNRFFRESLGISGLCLRASTLGFPWQGQDLNLQAVQDEKWDRIHQLFTMSSNLPSSSNAFKSV